MKLYVHSTEDIMCMARVGWVLPHETNGIEIYIHTNDGGNVPHFHVRKYGKHNKFEWEVCVAFQDAKYFKHGKYKDEFPNTKIAKDLDKTLRMVDPDSRHGSTYWEIAIEEWNRNNSDRKIPLDLVQPDYRHINGTM